LGFVAGLIPPPRLYLHAAVGVSRNLKRPWLKDLELIGDRELSLNNQDKVENGKSALSAVLKKPY
jgi:hypothetical protein